LRWAFVVGAASARNPLCFGCPGATEAPSSSVTQVRPPPPPLSRVCRDRVASSSEGSREARGCLRPCGRSLRRAGGNVEDSNRSGVCSGMMCDTLYLELTDTSSLSWGLSSSFSWSVVAAGGFLGCGQCLGRRGIPYGRQARLGQVEWVRSDQAGRCGNGLSCRSLRATSFGRRHALL